MEMFFATLSGAEEVPPVTTTAGGMARLNLSPDEMELNFRVQVNNIENMTEGHIHVGARGENGPIVAFLFGPFNPPGITTDEFVETGTVTAQDLIGPLQGRQLSDLVREMREGNTYVNVHTVQNPAGEIRGQIQHRDFSVFPARDD